MSNIPLLAEEGWPKAGVVRPAKVLRPEDFAELTKFYATRYRARASRPSARNKVASHLLLLTAHPPLLCEEGNIAGTN